jgi:O-antigen ligase
MKMDRADRPKATMGAYLVGIYLFSVPAFAYSEFLGLSIIPQVLGALLVTLAIFDIIGNQTIKIPFEIQLYGFLGLWAAATFIFNSNSSDWHSLGTFIKVVFATLACAQLLKDETDFFVALRIFVFSILFVFYQNINDLRYLRIAEQITETDRFAGTLANANTAAIFSLTIIWVSIMLFLRSRKGLSEWILFVIPTGISLVIIYYSGSKKGLIGIGIFALFLTRLLYLRMQSSLYKKSLVILVSALLLIVAGYFIYSSPFFFRIENLFRGESVADSNRIDLATDAIRVWLMNLRTFFLGVGYDNFRSFSHLQDYAHSTPLELVASNGLIGFSLFIGFLFLLLRKFYFLYRRTLAQEVNSTFFVIIIFLALYTFFMAVAVLHDSRELMPIMGALAAFGQFHARRLGKSQLGGAATSVP